MIVEDIASESSVVFSIYSITEETQFQQ